MSRLQSLSDLSILLRYCVGRLDHEGVIELLQIANVSESDSSMHADKE